MRIYFREFKRAKKAAKSLAASTSYVKLSAAQEAIATMAGYRDWHDLTRNYDREPANPPTTSRQNNQSGNRAISMTLTLAGELSLAMGDALYALVQTNLLGIQMEDVQHYEALWLQLFKETQHFEDGKRSPGKVVRIKSKSAGWRGVQAILKKYGSATDLITHKAPNALVADFEVVFPRKPLPLFVPARLKLAYGCWTEASGSKVLFSRDYKPLWRLTAGRKPERLQPWLWIDYVDSQLFWDDSNTPWRSLRRREEEEQRLRNFGVSALPKLVDTLPDLVFNENVNTVGNAVALMARREDPTAM